jgi:dTDP-4-dehydrorhamnose 3,5-epimerase
MSGRTVAIRDVAPSALTGVRFGTVARHADARGAFREIWRASGYPEADRFVQANLSSSSPGVLRGLHLHQRQMDHWVVASGRAFVALVDVRPMLSANGPSARPMVETRELLSDDWVDIPAGVAHGFLALEPLDLIYLVTNEFDGTDELGFAWDDPLVEIDWPAITRTPGAPSGRPILSERDQANPALASLVEGLRR